MSVPPRLQALLAPSVALYSIRGDLCFLDETARVLLDVYRGYEESIADLTIYVPTKRAARGLAEAFFEENKSKGDRSVLLPKIKALGEVSEEELLIGNGAIVDESYLPPAANPIERRLLLAHLVRKRYEYADWASSLRAADELGRFMDSFYLEGVDPDALNSVVSDDVTQEAAAHWKSGLEFVRLVTEHWPAILNERGTIDGADRNHRLSMALASLIGEERSAGPVIIAGSLGTVAGSAALIAAVSRSPQGLVILPGFDAHMSEKDWQAVDSTHPQAVFRDLISSQYQEQSRDIIQDWPTASEKPPLQAPRQNLLSIALKPSHATGSWYKEVISFDDKTLEKACKGVSRCVARTQNEEALFISLAIREALEVDRKTIMLVTPDRELAQRVTEKLRIWSIKVDDTGGVPLRGTYRGTFFRLIGEWLEDPSSPTALLALLTHPLSALGRGSNDWRAHVRTLDRILRGRRCTWSFEQLKDFISKKKWSESLSVQRDDILTLVDELSVLHEPWAQCKTISEKLVQHIRVGEQLATSAESAGADRLWIYEDGEGLARHLNSILSTDIIQDMGLPEDERYATLFDAFLSGVAVRKKGGHDRIHIFGLLEARLQTADLVILGGLNEGVWPDARDNDPFLSRLMRQKLGIPTAETLVGRAAHDFLQAASASSILLSYSGRRGGAPVPPSRWMVRLENILKNREYLDRIDRTEEFRQWADILHRPTSLTPILSPKPSPPSGDRPRSYSVSDFELLLRDPYAIFAKKVLGLRAWDPLSTPESVADRGSFFHECAESFVLKHPDVLPSDLEMSIEEVMSVTFKEKGYSSLLWYEWMKARSEFVPFFSEFERASRTVGPPLGVECEGAMTFLSNGTELTIRGRADRIDAMSNRSASVIDFKSGEKVPTDAQKTKFSPQLLLLALMMEKGGFEGIQKRECERIGFLRFHLKSKGDPFKGSSVIEGEKLRKAIDEAEKLAHSVLSAYMSGAQPYLSQPRPEYADGFGRYDHLARRAEWASEADDD